jgi:hypothetical protein
MRNPQQQTRALQRSVRTLVLTDASVASVKAACKARLSSTFSDAMHRLLNAHRAQKHASSLTAT